MDINGSSPAETVARHHSSTISLSQLAWLSSIFGFPDLPAPAHQSFEAIRYYGQQFAEFLATMQHQAVASTSAAAVASVLLPDDLALYLVFPDGWEFDIGRWAVELLVKRMWDPAKYPKWLVFEVEGQLQIRPSQYQVAQQLMDNPGAITQLNMGEGKTRVILPMLALHWADGKRVVRLNFLSKLLPEAQAHLAQVLTASVLGVKLFNMPFHRHIKITIKDVRVMRAALLYCQQVGGLLLVAPEHRLSLQHKWRELWEDQANAALCGELQVLLKGLPYLDLLDESDELLNHRYQLVYACGDPLQLPSLPERSAAVQAVLGVLCRMVDEGHPAVADEKLAVWQPAQARKPGSMCGLQLLPGDALESSSQELMVAVAQKLLSSPGHHDLRWLQQHPEKGLILACITDKSQSAADLLDPARGALGSLSDDKKDHLLAVRGLLACGLLLHCLQRRHRVHYGVSRLPSAKKRLAVPFRAGDTPDERSEFAQPDVALLFTHLAYYSDGLSPEELKAALRELLRLGGSAQRAVYEQEWLPLSLKPYFTADQLSTIDSVAKLDLTNALQLQQLHATFSHNRAAVNFFLSNCVLPTDMQQYPLRLTGTSWDLAQNAVRAVVGFSGTNDHHRLLPLPVHQAEPADEQLKGTNGKMLDLLMTKAVYRTLPPAAAGTGNAEGRGQQWLVLDMALSCKADALVDCGALLAGADISGIVTYLLQHEQFHHQGVCYFCPSSKQWMIQDREGRSSPKQASTLTESECFIIFDDARCRGADLKLRQTALGLLTVAPGMQKDKLMQAAGRMRQLGRGQQLAVVGMPDVTEKIWAAAAAAASATETTEPNMQQVLQWTMANTIKASQSGLPEWAAQGAHFAATADVPEKALQPEKMQLNELYASKKVSEPVEQLVAALMSRARQLCTSSNNPTPSSIGLISRNASTDTTTRLNMLADIEQRGQQLGKGYSVVTGAGMQEEVERELQEEEEQEEEKEVEVAQVQPAEEEDWAYSAALTALSVEQLNAAGGSAVGAMPLKDVMRLLPGDHLASIPWSTNVYCTANFTLSTAESRRQQANSLGSQQSVLPASGTAVSDIAHTTILGAAGSSLAEYLRPVGAMLVFRRTGELEVVLLSEREADGVQEQLWADGKTTATAAAVHKPVLVSLAYTQPLLASAVSALAAPAASAGKAWFGGVAVPIPVRQLVSVLLFNGCTTYDPSESQVQLLHEMMRGKKEAAEVLLSLRGKLALLARSDLELACDDHAPTV
eukprot:gene4976-5218_t